MLDALAFQMPRQRFSSARLSADRTRCARRWFFIVVVRFFGLRQVHSELGCKKSQLLARKLFAFASGFGLQQLPEQALGAIQLRGHVDHDLLQRFRIFGKCLGIDGQAQV